MPLSNYLCVYFQETRADKHAACTHDLAEGGARCFERLADHSKKCGSFQIWLQKNPLLWRLLTGYPTHEDRAKILHDLADKLMNKHEI
jgi:hypothetical protein